MRFLFGKKKIRLAVEFGLILAVTAMERKVELTPEIVIRAQEIFLNECKTRTNTQVAVMMVPNILAALEPKEVKSSQ